MTARFKGNADFWKKRKEPAPKKVSVNAFEFIPQEIPGVMVIKPNHKFKDERGYFMESYKRSEFEAAGIKEHFVQENMSKSSALVLRGVHYQREPKAQGKLVQVVSGKIWDFYVDIRKDSPTFKRWGSYQLTQHNKHQLYLPPGMAHGFLALMYSKVIYKCTEEYSKEHEAGFRWDDKEIDITYPGIELEWTISEKDRNLPSFKERDKIWV